jgi:hypothetical protein
MNTAAKPAAARGKLFAVAPMMDGKDKLNKSVVRGCRVRIVCSKSM